MIPKRRRRSITVGSKTYYWYSTEGRRYEHKRPHLAVLPSAGGQLLLVERICFPVTLAVVTSAIEDALKAGWDENGSGQFVLHLDASSKTPNTMTRDHQHNPAPKINAAWVVTESNSKASGPPPPSTLPSD